jgi:hypothetical protein
MGAAPLSAPEQDARQSLMLATYLAAGDLCVVRRAAPCSFHAEAVSLSL